MRIRSRLSGLLFLVTSMLAPPALPEFLVMDSGEEHHVEIISFDDNVLRYNGPAGYTVTEFQYIRSARVDPKATGKGAEQQAANVERLNRLIDVNKYAVKDLSEQVLSLVENMAWDELETLAVRLNSTAELAPDCGSMSFWFYSAMSRDIGGRNVVELQQRAETMKQWLAERPNSVTARIALMKVMVRLAWSHRGGGFSNTLTESRSENFKRTLTEALAYANNLDLRKIDDPNIYQVLIEIHRGLSFPKADAKNLAIESINRFPDYTPSLGGTLSTLLPRWFGRPGEVAEFLDEATMVHGQRDHYLYYRAVYGLQLNVDIRELAESKLDWGIIQEGFKHQESMCLTLDRDYHRMVKLALAFKDADAAQDYLSKTDGEWNFHAEEIWDDKAIYERLTNNLAELANVPNLSVFVDILIESSPDFEPALNEHLRHYSIDAVDAFGDSLIHLAISTRDSALIRSLIRKGANLDAFNTDGYNALHHAIYRNDALIAHTILAANIDLSARTLNSKQTALHMAADRGYDELAAVLLTTDQSIINELDGKGFSALHRASSGGYDEVVRVLHRFDALDLDIAGGPIADTPLHSAINRDQTKTAALLLEFGANPNIKNARRHTALSLAKSIGATDLVDQLVRLGAEDSGNAITEATIKQAEEILEEAYALMTKDPKRCLELVNRSIELNPDDYRAEFLKGLTLWRFGKDATAGAVSMKRSLELNPANNEALYWYGRINFDLQRPDIYTPYFQRYIQLEPDSYNAQDLKQNWSRLLVDQPTTTNFANPDTSVSAFLTAESWIRYLLIGAVLAILVLLVLARRRSQKTTD